MTERLARTFNALPCPPKVNIDSYGRTSNEWHFDLRYIHHEPIPLFYMCFVNPQARGLRLCPMPMQFSETDCPGHYMDWFPETATDAAPAVAGALLHLFAELGHCGRDRCTKCPLNAPWRLTTSSQLLANAVCEYFKRIGVDTSRFRNIGVSTARTMGIVNSLFTYQLDNMEAVGHLDDVPAPVTFLEKPVEMYIPAQPENLKGDALYAWMSRQYCAVLARGMPPEGGPFHGPSSLVKEHGLLVEYQQLFKQRRTEQQVRSEAESPGAEATMATLEYGIRLYLGLGFKPDRKRAREYLTHVADLNTPGCNKHKGIAHGLLIFWYMDALRNQPLPRHFLYAAYHHANHAAVLCQLHSPPGSLSSPAVLWLLRTTMDVKDARNTYHDFNSTLYPHLFRAGRERIAQMSDLCDDEIERRQRFPHWYRCAAADCDVEANTSSALSRCAGLCDKDMKPRYCSWQCQRADWPAHKRFCRPGSRTSVKKKGVLRQIGQVGSAGGVREKQGMLTIACSHARSLGTTFIVDESMTSAELKALRDVTEGPKMAKARTQAGEPWLTTYFTH